MSILGAVVSLLLSFMPKASADDVTVHIEEGISFTQNSKQDFSFEIKVV